MTAVASILRTYLNGRKRAAERRNLVAELNGLDDASLADIGLKRWEISEAADRFSGPKGPSFASLVGRLSALTIGRAARRGHPLVQSPEGLSGADVARRVYAA